MQIRDGSESDAHPPALAAPSKGRARSRLALVLGILLAIIAFYTLGGQQYFSWDFIRAHLDDWDAEVQQNLLLALALFFTVYVMVTALSLPVAVPLTLVGGALFGRWLGTGVISIASTLGATLAFLGSRYLLRDWVQQRFASRLEAINQGVEREGIFYLLTLRLVPVVPFVLINLGMGLTPMRVFPFMVVSWAGMLVGTFLYVNVGTELRTLDSFSGLVSPKILVSLGLLGIVPLALRKIIDWHRARAGKA